ncbi:phosphopantetheine-binding protein [Oleiagrimonas sp.]|jgi:acyl carrier protein|uniref:acyl carrier protein n=1 Tax=Oleiagrimonas sp. TaxID=2010330 RepID=UPI0026385D8C|nr:phosphopantetheine-binding protein [Oleiagrimonas sp.]MDA3914487.1 phosphopantetheine-binding protein [Oleiagrimonas sp.]
MSESVQQQILDIIAKHGDIDTSTLKPESTLTDLGIDSLEAIEIIFDIEEHFDITLPEQDPDFDADTAGGLVKAVEAALAAKSDGEDDSAA